MLIGSRKKLSTLWSQPESLLSRYIQRNGVVNNSTLFNCLICLTTEASNQNRAARVLTFSRYDVDANRFFGKLNWKDLSTQFQIQKALMIYKSLNDLVPGYLSSKFVKRYETRYSLRDSVNKVIVPFPRTNFMKNSFSYSGAVLWNSLPRDMREAKSLSQFKRLAYLNF